jgi:hypothetical protein
MWKTPPLAVSMLLFIVVSSTHNDTNIARLFSQRAEDDLLPESAAWDFRARKRDPPSIQASSTAKYHVAHRSLNVEDIARGFFVA